MFLQELIRLLRRLVHLCPLGLQIVSASLYQKQKETQQTEKTKNQDQNLSLSLSLSVGGRAVTTY